MNILFTICGRAGSKGIKNKNFKEFLGIPLIFYTIAAIDLYIKSHQNISGDIALNTDSEIMMDLVKKNSVCDIHIVERCEKLAMDHSPKVPVIADTLKRMSEIKDVTYDMVVDLDITSPLRTIQDIENIIDEKMKSGKQVIFSVTEARRNPYFNMVCLKEGKCSLVIPGKFTARQQAPVIYDMNASLYAYDPAFLQSGIAMFEAECGMIKMMDTGILDLDHENDFELMQVIAKYLFETKQEFGIIHGHAQDLIGKSKDN